MVEGSQIDWGSHDNDAAYTVAEMLDFDAAIGRVMAWAEQDGRTLVVVTGDHETGGLAIHNGSFAEKTVTAAFTTKGHTGVMVPVFAYGPGAEAFAGVYENTEIFHRLKAALGL
jgi:alkaline phosphatase